MEREEVGSGQSGVVRRKARVGSCQSAVEKRESGVSSKKQEGSRGFYG